MSWDSVLKKNLLKSILANPINSARDPHKKRTHSQTQMHFVSKLTLNDGKFLLVSLNYN